MAELTGVNLGSSQVMHLADPEVGADMTVTDYVHGDGVHKITVGPTPPADPREGDLWLDTSEGAS